MKAQKPTNRPLKARSKQEQAAEEQQNRKASCPLKAKGKQKVRSKQAQSINKQQRMQQQQRMQIKKCRSSRRRSSCDSSCEDGDGDSGDGGGGLLSDDLLVRVAAFFPNVADVARFGLLSTTWYSIVHSPSFWRLRSNNNHHPSSCLLLRPSTPLPRPLRGLDPATPWCAYLPTAQRWTSFVCACLKPGYYGRITSSRGLICAQEPELKVVVFNPLTNSCRALPYDKLLLPPAEHHGGCAHFQLSFSVDPVTLSYMVVIFQFNNSSCYPVLYDSKTKSWRRGKTVPCPHADTTPPAPVPALTGSFYFLAQDGTSIVRYHARTDCWSTIKLRPPAGLVVPRSQGAFARLRTPCRKTLLVFPALIESMGRLLLVGGYEAATVTNGLQQTLCIWELKEQEAAASTQELPWKALELTRMPQELWFDFISMQDRPGPYVEPAGAGDVICFRNQTDHRSLPYLCNLSTNSWHKVPAHPGFSTTEDLQSPQVVVFEPRLDSLA